MLPWQTKSIFIISSQPFPFISKYSPFSRPAVVCQSRSSRDRSFSSLSAEPRLQAARAGFTVLTYGIPPHVVAREIRLSPPKRSRRICSASADHCAISFSFLSQTDLGSPLALYPVFLRAPQGGIAPRSAFRFCRRPVRYLFIEKSPHDTSRRSGSRDIRARGRAGACAHCPTGGSPPCSPRPRACPRSRSQTAGCRRNAP